MEKEKRIGEWKNIMVRELEETLKKDANFYLSNYLGLTADEFNKLRILLETHSSKYLVLKNSVAKIALKNAGLSELTKFIEGGTGMVTGGKDPISAARAVAKFSKKHQALKLKGGYLDGEVIDQDRISYIASLPAREELIAKIVFGISAPLSGLVGVLGNTLKKFLYVIQAIKDKKGG